MALVPTIVSTLARRVASTNTRILFRPCVSAHGRFRVPLKEPGLPSTGSILKSAPPLGLPRRSASQAIGRRNNGTRRTWGTLTIPPPSGVPLEWGHLHFSSCPQGICGDRHPWAGRYILFFDRRDRGVAGGVRTTVLTRPPQSPTTSSVVWQRKAIRWLCHLHQ